MLRSLLLAILSLFVLTTARAEVIDIDNAELARLKASGVPLIDIRTEGEWKSTGVIDGSKLLTFFDERGRASPAQWLAQARAIARSDQPVILICRSGNRTREATRFLSEQAGYGKVYNVSNGVGGWLREGRPLMPYRRD